MEKANQKLEGELVEIHLEKGQLSDNLQEKESEIKALQTEK